MVIKHNYLIDSIGSSAICHLCIIDERNNGNHKGIRHN